MTYPPGRRAAAESASAIELRANLPTAGPDYLTAALSNPDLDEDHLDLIVRSRAADEALLRRIVSSPQWSRSYKVKVGLVRNPRTPRSAAMSLLKFLFWRDLAMVVDDIHLPPPIRREAERLLIDRIPEMTVGERIALARMGGRPLLPRLAEDGEEQVLEALLWNGRMTEQDVISVIGRLVKRAESLEVIARHPRWRECHGVRLALVLNPGTPLSVSLGFLTSLTERDWRAISTLEGLPPLLSLTARRILDETADRTSAGPGND